MLDTILAFMTSDAAATAFDVIAISVVAGLVGFALVLAVGRAQG